MCSQSNRLDIFNAVVFQLRWWFNRLTSSRVLKLVPLFHPWRFSAPQNSSSHTATPPSVLPSGTVCGGRVLPDPPAACPHLAASFQPTSAAHSQNWSVSFSPSAEPSISPSEHITLPVDDDLTLQCNLTSAHSAHDESFWMKNGEEIPETRSKRKNTDYKCVLLPVIMAGIPALFKKLVLLALPTKEESDRLALRLSGASRDANLIIQHLTFSFHLSISSKLKFPSKNV